MAMKLEPMTWPDGDADLRECGVRITEETPGRPGRPPAAGKTPTGRQDDEASRRRRDARAIYRARMALDAENHRMYDARLHGIVEAATVRHIASVDLGLRFAETATQVRAIQANAKITGDKIAECSTVHAVAWAVRRSIVPRSVAMTGAALHPAVKSRVGGDRCICGWHRPEDWE